MRLLFSAPSQHQIRIRSQPWPVPQKSSPELQIKLQIFTLPEPLIRFLPKRSLCRCDAFQRVHFLKTHRHCWGQKWRLCRGRGFLKELYILGDTPSKLNRISPQSAYAYLSFLLSGTLAASISHIFDLCPFILFMLHKNHLRIFFVPSNISLHK